MPYRTETIIFFVFMTLFSVSMIAFIIYILLFLEKKQKSFKVNLMEIKLKYDKELSQAHIESQEHTLRQIGRELHDNIGQMISLAKMGVGSIDLNYMEEAKNNTADVMSILESTLADVRDLSRSMNYNPALNGDLKKSIEMQVGFLQRAGDFNVQLNTIGDPVKIAVDKEIILFRILQEALNNIVRHSFAKNIVITLHYNPAKFRMEISDDGRGFDMSEMIQTPHKVNGIYNMQNRADLIGADFKIISEKGRGTLITVTTDY